MNLFRWLRGWSSDGQDKRIDALIARNLPRYPVDMVDADQRRIDLVGAARWEQALQAQRRLRRGAGARIVRVK